MGCPTCQRLEGEMDWLKHVHGERLHNREDHLFSVRSGAHGRLRSAENEALLALEIARAELNQHKRKQHTAAE
jgi:hypothetical protein